MTTTMTSQLHFFSVGKVAENKHLSEDYIRVIPIEHTGMLHGELKSNEEIIQVKGIDKDGNEYDVATSTDTVIVAKWFPLDSNRISSPDVRRDETVLLWRYGDTDQFYWSSTNLHRPYRKLETVQWAFSGTQDEDDGVVSDDNCYFAEVSTHTKTLTIKTSQANGEVCIYRIQINPGNGHITFKDDQGNFWLFDTVERLHHFENQDGTKLMLDKMEIYGYCKQRAKVRSETYIHATAPKIDLGEESYLEPSVLGDQMAIMMAKIEKWLNCHFHIGNLGIPTSAPVEPLNIPEGKLGGSVYSKRNRNQ